MNDKPLIAIVGRPNVGKSTLFNRILGKRSALVQNQPGVTRDRHYAESDWDGVSFRLVDTGGLEFSTEKRITKKVTEQALEGIEEADILVLVMDGRAGVTMLDREWVDRVRKIKKPKFFVVNKIDSAKEEESLPPFYELGLDPTPISAETGRKVGDLLDKIVEQAEGLVHQNSGMIQATKASIDEFKIAIVGRPNVGKSTLLNFLLGAERVIVDEEPGTTRDPVDALLNNRGDLYRLVDTAGIRKRGRTTEGIEKFSMIKSLKVIDKTDIVLLMIDGAEGVTAQDTHVAGEAFERGKGIIFIVNKWDIGEKKTTKEYFKKEFSRQVSYAGSYPLLFISAKTGMGVNSIFREVKRIRKQFEYRVPEQELREVFSAILENQTMPVFRGRNIQMGQIRQVGVKPPTFVVSTPSPRNVHFSYKRYLHNALSRAFGLESVPVRILFKTRF